MTFVRAKLMIETMQPGEVGTIRLRAGEPLANISQSLRAHGHKIVATTPIYHAEDKTEVYEITFRIKN